MKNCSRSLLMAVCWIGFLRDANSRSYCDESSSSLRSSCSEKWPNCATIPRNSEYKLAAFHHSHYRFKNKISGAILNVEIALINGCYVCVNSNTCEQIADSFFLAKKQKKKKAHIAPIATKQPKLPAMTLTNTNRETRIAAKSRNSGAIKTTSKETVAIDNEHNVIETSAPVALKVPQAPVAKEASIFNTESKFGHVISFVGIVGLVCSVIVSAILVKKGWTQRLENQNRKSAYRSLHQEWAQRMDDQETFINPFCANPVPIDEQIELIGCGEFNEDH